MYSLHAGCFKQEPAVQTQTLTQLQNDTITAVYNDKPYQLQSQCVRSSRQHFPHKAKVSYFLATLPFTIQEFRSSSHRYDAIEQIGIYLPKWVRTHGWGCRVMNPCY